MQSKINTLATPIIERWIFSFWVQAFFSLSYIDQFLKAHDVFFRKFSRKRRVIIKLLNLG